MLRALSSGGIFEEVSPRKFKNNTNSNALRSGRAMKDMVELVLGSSHSRGWLELPAAVKSGQSGVQKAFGCDIWKLYDAFFSFLVISFLASTY